MSRLKSELDKAEVRRVAESEVATSTALFALESAEFKKQKLQA